MRSYRELNQRFSFSKNATLDFAQIAEKVKRESRNPHMNEAVLEDIAATFANDSTSFKAFTQLVKGYEDSYSDSDHYMRYATASTSLEKFWVVRDASLDDQQLKDVLLEMTPDRLAAYVSQIGVTTFRNENTTLYADKHFAIQDAQERLNANLIHP